VHRPWLKACAWDSSREPLGTQGARSTPRKVLSSAPSVPSRISTLLIVRLSAGARRVATNWNRQTRSRATHLDGNRGESCLIARAAGRDEKSRRVEKRELGLRRGRVLRSGARDPEVATLIRRVLWPPSPRRRGPSGRIRVLAYGMPPSCISPGQQRRRRSRHSRGLSRPIRIRGSGSRPLEGSADGRHHRPLYRPSTEPSGVILIRRYDSMPS
jgi:hypothetical protein